MTRNRAIFLPLILFCFSWNSGAQLWSGILAPSRAIDWTQAGVTGGIPSRTTICTTLNSGASASQINAAISNCPSGQVVKLSAGSYSLNSGIMMKSGVTLRGDGASTTSLTFTGTCTTYWGTSVICFKGNYTGGFENNPPGQGGADPANLKNWTGTNGNSGTYTQGATVVNLSSVSGSPSLGVNDMLQCVQNDDASVGSGLFVCSNGSCSREGSGYTKGTGQRQHFRVKAINGTAVSVDPGVWMPNWRASQAPKCYWWGGDMRMAGIEDFRIANTPTNLGFGGGIIFFECTDCWMKGVAIHVASGARSHVKIHLSNHVTIQDSFLDPASGGGGGSTTSYGIEFFFSSSSMILNTILKGIESPVLVSGGSAGNVVAYNYETGGLTGIASHEIGFAYNLYEGNDISSGIRSDTFHGNQNLATMFRNHAVHGGQAAIDTWAYNRYYNIIGNVLADGGANRYECLAPDNSGQCARYATPSIVFRFGFAGANPGPGPENGVMADNQVEPTAMRWGNYDAVTGSNHFNCSEVPTSDANMPNVCPSNQNLPPSFLYSTRPGWWPTGKPWPAIGPDVTGGNIVGLAGHVYSVPAADCYAAIGGSIANFNASTCYTTQLPGPPQGLNAKVN